LEFRTIVDIAKPGSEIEPREELLFVGSCFADSIGQRFLQEQFRATVNPYGVMYNPASVLHTVSRLLAPPSSLLPPRSPFHVPRIVFLTLGTNHVYRLRETGEIVDNCQKRPQSLFLEEELSVDQCADYLHQAIDLLHSRRSDIHVVLTVSPIRYRKYGYHGSQLSKATLLLAVQKVITTLNAQRSTPNVTYFPAYEIVLDELRDYRFYAPDMLHPSQQAVEYIWQQLAEHYLSARAKAFLKEWAPLKAALAHRPFNAESDEYRRFLADTRAKVDALLQKYKS